LGKLNCYAPPKNRSEDRNDRGEKRRASEIEDYAQYQDHSKPYKYLDSAKGISRPAIKLLKNSQY
jgi:hypothetical protein